MTIHYCEMNTHILSRQRILTSDEEYRLNCLNDGICERKNSTNGIQSYTKYGNGESIL